MSDQEQPSKLELKLDPIFITATARGGSNLCCQMLSTNKNVTVASDPFLPIFKALRNAILRDAKIETIGGASLEDVPFHDYYFLDDGWKIVDAINKGSIAHEFSKSERDNLLLASKSRIMFECAELEPYLKKMRGIDFKALIDEAIQMIPDARKLTNIKWVGIKEAWTIELFLPLARAYPNAKFIVIVRDIRASISSNLQVKDSKMIAHVASFVRGWRKNIAFLSFLRRQRDLDGRLHVVSYEQLLNNPCKEAQKLCSFLEVEFEEAMLDTNNFIDYATGKAWIGNSSYETVTSGINPERIDRWKNYLSEDARCAVELLTTYDLKLIGRSVDNFLENSEHFDKALRFLVKDNSGYKNWRTDSQDPLLEYSREVNRLSMLSTHSPERSKEVIRANFLFEDSYKDLIEGGSHLA